MDDVDVMVPDSLPQRTQVLEHVPGPLDQDHFHTGCAERVREIIVFPIEDAEIKGRLGPLAADVVNERLRASSPETSQEKRDLHYLR